MKKFITIFIVLLFGFVYFFPFRAVPISEKIETNYAIIPYESQYNYRQGNLECAAYSTAAVLRALGKEIKDFDTYKGLLSWRIPRLGVHPRGLEKILQEYGLGVGSFDLGDASDEQRIQFLQENLSEGRPIILLGNKSGYQHYVTLFGFDAEKNEFYIYDSWHDKGENGYTVDDNGDLPGNRTMSEIELIEFWFGGGILNFYKWYALVASVNKEI